jgi:type IX secretion system PorP/SprF family membrane protein
MKKIILFMFLGIVQSAIAQQPPLFTLYREQTAFINPAMPSLNYIVSDFNNTISATYRKQWVSVEGAPTTQILNWETMLDEKNLLIGAYLLQDKVGDRRNQDLGEISSTNLYARVAYKIVLSEEDKRFLSIGLNAGAARYSTHLGFVAAKQGIVVDDKARIIPDLSMGVFYNHGKLFYAGVSVPQLLGNPIYLSPETAKTNLSLQRGQNFYAIGGCYLDAPFFGNDAAYLEPNAWVRYVPRATNPLTLALNLRAKISQAFWAGAGFDFYSRTLNIDTGSVLGESIGLSNGQLKIGFGFGIPLGKYWNYLSMGGDIHLSYSWANN